MPKKPARPQLPLLVLSLVMVVNALAYGIIIPLLYPYAARFGIGPVGLSFLFASFSLAQFLATPVLGRLSDRFGRKPVLLTCLAGTSLSLGMFALATNLPLLFLARMVDGITGGNISVAQAMIADKTTGAERAKSFGMLGAAFGMGFLVGPALGGFLGQYGLTVPFWFASALAMVSTILGIFFLKETLPAAAKRTQKHEPLFQFHALVKALFSPLIGSVLLIGLLGSVAHNAFVIGFQSFTVDALKLNTRDVGLLFAMFGIVNILAQAVGIRWLLTVVKSKKVVLVGSLLTTALSMVLTMFATSFHPFVVAMMAYTLFFSPQFVMVTGLLSERTNPEDQGAILGINQSYTSIGQIVGPLIAGAIADYRISWVFGCAAALFVLGALVSTELFKPVKKTANL